MKIHRVRRSIVLSVAAMGLLVAVPAEAATSLPSLFAHQIHTINAASQAPAVLLPRTMPLDAKHLYPSGAPSGSSYDLSVGAAAGCGDANACFVADFSATRGGKVFGRHVAVRGATKAGFLPLSCGGSCSPPQIDFVVGGVLYTIQANLTSAKGNQATLVSAAESAISAGPR